MRLEQVMLFHFPCPYAVYPASRTCERATFRSRALTFRPPLSMWIGGTWGSNHQLFSILFGIHHLAVNNVEILEMQSNVDASCQPHFIIQGAIFEK